MNKYITLIVASLMALTSMAQSITIEDEREFYGKAFLLMNEYAQSASVSDEEEEYRFRNLFMDDETRICIDLMSLSHNEKLTVDEYVSILQDAKRVKVEVKNMKKAGPVEDNEDVWVLPIAFEMGISYSKGGTLFKSTDYYSEKYYRLRAELSFNKETRECHISKLEADPQYERLPPFPESFRVLERTNEDVNRRNYKRDLKLTIDGREIKWNENGQVILREGENVKYNNSKVELDIIPSDKDGSDKDGGTKYRANYNDKSFRVRANMGYSLSDFNQLADVGANSPIHVSESKEMSFGVDFGYVFPTTSKFYFGIFTGLNMSSNSFTMNLGPTVDFGITDIGECTADEDGDRYKRHYVLKGTGVAQQLKATNLTIPVYGDLEYQLTPLLSAYADLGVLIRMSSGTWSAHIDGYETSGIYSQSQYGGVEIKGDVNLNGFGSWGPRDMEVYEEDMENAMTIHALAGLGLRLNLSNSFAFDAGVQYLTGGKSWKMNSDKISSVFDYSLPVGATAAVDKAQGDKVNLLRQAGGIKAGAFRVTASLIYKF